MGIAKEGIEVSRTSWLGGKKASNGRYSFPGLNLRYLVDTKIISYSLA